MFQTRAKTIAINIILILSFILTGCGSNGDLSWSGKSSGCRITGLTVNYEENPIGIETQPLFGWRMESDEKNQLQTAYRIVVAESPEHLEKKDYVWDSGKTESDRSVAIPYEGEALAAGESYVWRVSVWDRDEREAESSEASFEMGLTDGDWSGASWIGVRAPEKEKQAHNPQNYTIAYDVKLGKTHSGFIWGMDTNQYGTYYRCDINTLGENLELSVSEICNTELVDENTMTVRLDEAFPEVFPSAEEFCGREHHVMLQGNSTGIRVVVDGTEVLVFAVNQVRALENIGLWTARGAYYAYYDNIRITDDQDGIVIYEEDFEDKSSHLFSPYYIRTVDGWCEASSGFLLTPGVEEPAPMLRREFEKDSNQQVVSARLYATALGDYRIYLNGTDICGEYLTPGRSIYSKETYYRTYDVMPFLNDAGENDVIGAVIGHGRYDKANADWGEQIAFQAKLVLQYADGRKQIIVTDDTWQAFTDGPIRNDDMFLGEYYDAAKEQSGWCESGYLAVAWQQAEVFHEYDSLEKKAGKASAVKCIGTRAAVSVSEPVEGQYVYDFGQNFNGNCQITLKNTGGKRGQAVTIRYAEALNQPDMSCRDDEVGTIWTQNLYMADNTDYYIMSGSGEETYTPSLVCRGFRYVQISGIDEPIPLEDISGLVITSEQKRTGYFTCSDEQINRLYESIYWTQLSNYLDVPTDCPQRDERFGWAGDAQVFAHTADYNADIYNYMLQYTQMLLDGQCDNGALPEIAPGNHMDSGANGWSDAGIILIWELYQQYGNEAIIRENLDAMCQYVDYLVDTSEDYVRWQHNYSDHNAVSGLDDEIANTAQCAYVSLLLSKMSRAVGENDIANRYDMVYNQYKNAWQSHYINEDGSIDCWLQSAYAMGLAFELYPEELEEKGAACLNNAVVANDYHLNTGYIATQLLLPVLCQYGYVDTAYKILQQDTYPSWNDMLSRDQTTITEAWHTYYDTGDGTYAINGSLNHFALGSVGQWMYSDMLGIRRDENYPGYQHFFIEPQPGGGLTYASGSYESVYGTIESSWQVEGSELVFRFTIPANTTATVSLPDAQYRDMELGSGTYEYRITP